MSDARLSARSECYGTALRKASRRVTTLYDETLAPSGLRSTQFAILAEIVDRDEGPPTLNQLADDLVLDRSGLGHSLRPLEREGLIRLEKSSRDRRSTLVALTDQGRQRYAYALTLWQNAQDRYAAVVGEAQADELRQRLLEIGHGDELTKRQDSA
jgi:DNA-binding MarR family transcriptional regulator